MSYTLRIRPLTLIDEFASAGKAVVRPYTPTSPVNQRGSFELIVKTYPEGKVSKALWDLKEGSR